MRNIKLFIAISLLFGYQLLYAQYFKRLGVKDGLPQLSVMSIHQDQLGRMWFGTKEGLAAYDGEEMFVFRPWNGLEVKNQKRTIDENNVQKIISDQKGDLFMFIDGHLVKFDLEKESFSTFPQQSIHALSEHKGEIWTVSKDSVYQYNPNTQQLDFRFKIDILPALAILWTNEGLMAGDSNGLYLYKDDKRHTLLNDIHVYDLFQSSIGEIWISTAGQGLYKINTKGQIQHFPLLKGSKIGISSLYIRQIIEDDQQNIWFGTFDGLQKYDIQTQQFSLYQADNKEGSISHSSVFSLCKDKQGTIWVGTYYGGVNHFNPQKTPYIYYPSNPDRNDCIHFPIVSDIVEDKDSNIWIGTDGGGINILNKNSNKMTYYLSGIENKLLHNNIKTLCYDEENDCIYAGTHTGGLTRFDRKNRKVHHFLEDYKQTGKGPNDVIFKISYLKGKIYVSARNGIFILDTTSGIFTKIPVEESFYQTYCIDHAGYIWLVGYYSIISINLNNPSEQTSYLFKDYGIKQRILTIIEGSDGLLYIGTLGQGMFTLDHNSGKIHHYTAEHNNLLSNYCYNIIETPQHNILIASDRGLSLLNPQSGGVHSIVLGEAGLISSCVVGSGLYVGKDNQIYVGGSDGMMSFCEQDVTLIPTTSTLYFSALYVHNKRVFPDDENGILSKALPFCEQLHLEAQQNNFTLYFNSSNYINVQKPSGYEYMLEGFDKQWTQTNANTIRYTNMPPGSYVLKVREIGSTQHLTEKQLSIVIHYPWYNTYWAWSIYLLSLGIILFMILSEINSRRKLSMSLEFEKLDKERIEQMNQAKLRFFTNVSHEFRTPLTLIISHLDLLLQSSTVTPTVYKHGLKIQKQANHMRNLVTELLNFRKFDQNHIHLKLVELDIDDFIKEIYLTFSEYAMQRQINYTMESTVKDVKVWIDDWQMKKVFSNLLSNAFKYTPEKGDIYIQLLDETDYVTVIVSDSGEGIDPKDLPHIFNHYYQAEHSNMQNMSLSTGIGLALTKSIVELHHGEIKVKSTRNEGSQFTVKLTKDKTVFKSDKEVTFLATIEKAIFQNNTLPDEAFMEEMKAITDTLLKKVEKESYQVLVVEDNSDLLQILQDIFSPLYRVAIAHNGEEGLQMAMEIKPDLIISDVMMPLMSGTEMCLNIKENIKLCHIPVVLLTALDTADQNLEGLKRGADDYITKPFNAKILLARCNNLLRNRLILQNRYASEVSVNADLLATNPLDKAFLEQVERFVESQLDNPELNIPLLCKEVGMGKTLLHSKFKALAGMTPNDFILNYRLKKAAYLLKYEPYLQIAEIADKLGFGSPRYFTRCFKNHYHITPVEYKKNEES